MAATSPNYITPIAEIPPTGFPVVTSEYVTTDAGDILTTGLDEYITVDGVEIASLIELLYTPITEISSASILDLIATNSITKGMVYFSVDTKVLYWGNSSNSVVQLTDPVGSTTDASRVIVQKEALTNLSGHRVVSSDVAGKIYYTDVTVLADVRTALGITTGAISIGVVGDVLLDGEIVEPSWTWTAGSPVYLTGLGVLTQVVPTSGFMLEIGIPSSATSLRVAIKQLVSLD